MPVWHYHIVHVTDSYIQILKSSIEENGKWTNDY